MRQSELKPSWVHGVALAICFFGWVGLSLYFDGMATMDSAARALSAACLFTTAMAIVDLAVWAYRR
jgi:hypothetical protein